MLLAVTLSPDWLNEAFHMPVIFWLPGKVQPALQPLSPEAPAVTVTWAWNPPDQPSTIAYLAVQPLPPPPPLEPMGFRPVPPIYLAAYPTWAVRPAQ
jgi:hypothetical protein